VSLEWFFWFTVRALAFLALGFVWAAMIGGLLGFTKALLAPKKAKNESSTGDCVGGPVDPGESGGEPTGMRDSRQHWQ
jgi:hypothetical protein